MNKAVMAMVALAGTGYGVYHWQSSDAPPPPATQDSVSVTDRLWIDHIPRGERDVIQIFAAITEEPMGVFQAASRWKGEFEMFRYEPVEELSGTVDIWTAISGEPTSSFHGRRPTRSKPCARRPARACQRLTRLR